MSFRPLDDGKPRPEAGTRSLYTVDSVVGTVHADSSDHMITSEGGGYTL